MNVLDDFTEMWHPMHNVTLGTMLIQQHNVILMYGLVNLNPYLYSMLVALTYQTTEFQITNRTSKEWEHPNDFLVDKFVSRLRLTPY